MDKKDQLMIPSVSSGRISKLHQHNGRKMNWVRTSLSIGMLVITAVLSACSSATSTVNPEPTQPVASGPMQTAAPTEAIALPPTSTPQDTATPTAAVVPAATSGPQQAVTTQLDPCVLISSQEASKLAGTTFGTGEEGSTPGGLKICTYGSQTTNVFTVDVVQAPDENTAKADKAQFLADIQANAQQLTSEGLNVTEVPNFADGATMATMSVSTGGTTVNGSAFGFLKGTVFFGFSDLVVGGAAPDSAALQSEATTVLAKLP